MLRRFEASGVSIRSVVVAQALVTGFLMGTLTMLSLGVALGLAAPTARAAQALGLLAFMPMWLLGGGGPPKAVMADAMQQVSEVLPLWHVTAGIRGPWLGTGDVGSHALALAVWLGLGLVCSAMLVRRRAD